MNTRRVTEGRLYTAGVAVIVALLLVPSLARLHAPPNDKLAAPVARANASVSEPALDAAPLPDFAPLPALDGGVFATGDAPLAPAPGIGGGVRSPAPSGPAAPPPCPAQATNDAVKQLLAVADAAGGGLLPDKTVVSALAVATGCSTINPAILAIAALIDVGSSLPDLGLDALEPQVPFIEIPAPLLPLLAPLKTTLQPVCAQIGTVASVVFIAAPYYPAPIDGVFTTTLFHALSVCGQINTA